jgi:hypothetical protein
MDSSISTLSFAPSEPAPASTNAFNRLIARAPTMNTIKRDTCFRPISDYNANYDPYKLPSEIRALGYSPYIYGEPLFDDRLILTSRLPVDHYLIVPSKSPRIVYIWKLGYALTDISKVLNPMIWACKLYIYCLLYMDLF